MWGGGCPPGEAKREKTPQSKRGGRDEPGQRRPGKNKSRDPNKDGGEWVGGRERPYFPRAARQPRDCGLPATQRTKRTAQKQASQGSPAGWVYPRPPTRGESGRAPSYPSIRLYAPQHGSSPSVAAPRSSRSTARHPSRWAPRALEEQGEASPRRHTSAAAPTGPGGAGVGGGGRGKGRAGENGGVAGACEGTEHSRPAPRVAPPQRDTSGTDAARNARPGPLTCAGGGRL
ncbi:unnamed protein product [Coccothraustes coccothraustes]